ncbi:MAG: protein kinase [Pirellulaceae bacterium]|nr:protein kinase [Pirellulaceae bacterium]
MTSLVSGVEPGFEPIEGYVLRERIGAGGYGEVWLADAPGGLQKAIKFVFGSIDERAGIELRSLQRIRAVHHPFILSLERFEIINKQLIVVTELADCSLFDRFREYHQRGLIGIPRNRLLEYLRDTADALDFLCQKHDLQHLDVKPANLLLVADRVKVADFGLIKDLHNKSISIMSGMTPTYAAPEMFDGRPGRFSDQYSLAIVYQELLTGTLPFNGRTTAQLATEHLHKAPNLDSLPASERPIIGKALAKKPSQRFSSCRELVDHLYRVQITADASVGSLLNPNANLSTPKSSRVTPRPVAAAPKAEPKQTVSWAGIGASTDRREVVELPAITIPKELPSSLAPSLFIGVGGTGADVLTLLRSRLQQAGLDPHELSDVAWIQADTDEATLQRATDPTTAGRLSYDDVLFIPLRAAQQYRERPQDAYTPLSRRWLYNVPRSLSTEGVRPMGMLAYLDHASACYQMLHSTLSKLIEQQPESNQENKPIRIYFVGSSHGGTGSVLTIELAFLVRRILAELNAKAIVQSVLCVGDQSDFASTELATATGVSCMHEIAHFYKTDGLYPGIPGLQSDFSSNPPWQQVYLVHGGALGKQAAWRNAIEQMTDFLTIDACTTLGEIFDSERIKTFAVANETADREWVPWLRMFASRRLDLSSKIQTASLVRRLALQSLQEWLVALSVPEAKSPTPISPKSTKDLPLAQRSANQSIELFVSDLFREMKWTAQSWVRRCMEHLFPLPKQSDNPELEQSSEIPSPPIADNLEHLDKLGLEEISESLGISLAKSQVAAQALLDESVQGLLDWLRTRWLKSFEGWSQLRDVLTCISQRFNSQSLSLKTVADRIHQQRDTLLNSVYSQQVVAEKVQQDIVQQIRSLNMQASVHHTASRMLLRLGQHVIHIEKIWRNESISANEQFRIWTLSLAHELGISIDADGRIRDTWLPIPAKWFGVREVTQKSIEQALQSMVQKRFFAALLPSMLQDVSGAKETAQCRAKSPLTEARSFDEKRLQRLLEVGLGVSNQAAIKAGLIENPDKGKENSNASSRPQTNPAIDLNSQMLADHLHADDLKLLEDGGAKRTFLLLPKGSATPESIEQLKKNLNPNLTIVELDGIKTAILCVDGEQLDHSQIVYRLWLPSRERCQLAERLHSRNDIEWHPME